jgi:hypothetical protein
MAQTPMQAKLVRRRSPLARLPRALLPARLPRHPALASPAPRRRVSANRASWNEETS